MELTEKLSGVLSQSELETLEIEMSKGRNVFSALAGIPGVRPEAFRIAAENYGCEFAEFPPPDAKETEGCFVTEDAVYCTDPYCVPPSLLEGGRRIVVIPPVVKEEEGGSFWSELIKKAVTEGWGDIHYEPSDSIYKIRIRNSLGKIETYRQLEKSQGETLLRQLLALADISTSSLHVPADGRITFSDINSTDPAKEKLRKFLESIKSTPCDMRIAVVPTTKGHSCVIRILPKNRTISTNLAELGYSPLHVEKLSGYPKLSRGMILIVGPTGSGKSTLTWAMLKMADPNRRKILSIEDPVEADIPGVQQVEVKLRKDGEQLDFATAIRAFMRHNPDVIAVGEIRDTETARAAIQASNTGHLLISTLHANDEIEAIKRLLDLANDRDIAKVVNQMRLIVAQRLLPKVCPKCREKGLFPMVEINDSFLQRLPAESREIFEEKLKGQSVLSSNIRETCGECRGGFTGRVPVVGILEFNREIRDFIIKTQGSFETSEFLKMARAGSAGFKSYIDDAIEKLRNYEVTVEDVLEIL
jgi:type II secretory ATPase GspE/PulE/Tfp pilus assembly ATPase PilB-like protein